MKNSRVTAEADAKAELIERIRDADMNARRFAALRKQLALEATEAGASRRDISNRLGANPSTVHAWIVQAKRERNRDA